MAAIPGFEGVASQAEDAYLSNYGAHRVGITPAEVVEYYNQWCRRGDYEDVRATLVLHNC
jgi:hypothetical protein